MLTITINTRGLGWWLNQGLRCPDCDSSDLDVTESTKDDEVEDGTAYGATFNCNACGSNFTGSYLERG
jgi:transcriptional regulator NrdR family protein